MRGTGPWLNTRVHSLMGSLWIFSAVLRDVVHQTGSAAFTFEEFKKQALAYQNQEDSLQLMLENQRKSRGFWIPAQQKPVGQASTTNVVGGSIGSSDRRTTTGTTFGGRGQAMDLGKKESRLVCFNCGERGHMAWHCTKPRVPRAQVARVVETVQQEQAPVLEVKQIEAAPSATIVEVKEDEQTVLNKTVIQSLDEIMKCLKTLEDFTKGQR